MSKSLRWVSLPTMAMVTLCLFGCDSHYIVLDPKGPVGRMEYHLIVLSIILCAVVVIPVIAVLLYVITKFRDKPGNKAPFEPDWDDSKVLEFVWWAIPILIVGVLGFYTAKDTYALVKPPVKDVKPLTIQVTSLDWKWLFQYPDQKIATVNYCEIPTGVPVQFVLTADAPMNSFWVPQLGGQEYTMPGMAMRLWLQADQPGGYFGTGANFTGKGFAYMRFQVDAKPQTEFNTWVQRVKEISNPLTREGYARLSQPGVVDKQTFSSFPDGLFHEIVNKNGGQYYNHHMDGEENQPNQNEMSTMNMPTMKMN